MGWGEGNESRAPCTLSHLEHSQTGCPEVADSFEMAQQARVVEQMTVLGGTPPLRGGWLLAASFTGPVRVRRKKPAAVCLDSFNFGSCVQ